MARRPKRTRRSLSELRERAPDHLARYTSPDGHHGFATYDQSPVQTDRSSPPTS